jgi:hypothetical protein
VTDPVLLALAAANWAVLAVGLGIAVRALRGYRRTGSALMLALGVAFALLSVKPVVIAGADILLAPRTAGYAAVAGDVAFSGTAFAVVVAALYAGRGRAGA